MPKAWTPKDEQKYEHIKELKRARGSEEPARSGLTRLRRGL
jgi:hypothetical protein